MYAIRILSAAIAYSVVILEVYSGVINGPNWWVIPGGLILALLFALTLYGGELAGAPSGRSAGATFFQWLVILALSFGMSYGAYYFGHVIVPDLVHNPVFPAG